MSLRLRRDWLSHWENPVVIREVDESPFFGSILVAYQKIVPFSGPSLSLSYPVWDRLVLWKIRNSENALCAQYFHVNSHPCIRALVRARLQGDRGTGRNLFLVDYTPGKEVFEVDGKIEVQPLSRPIPGLPPNLEESDVIH